MSTLGLVMAGGAGSRMQQSGGTRPKPLVEVQGRTLLEHNVRAMLAAGVKRVVVSVRAGEVSEYAAQHCRPIAVAAGGTLDLLIESKPLGNIGCLGLLSGSADTVVVTYADNLTALNPADLMQQHAETKADLTLAAHWHPFQMPFGELHLDGTRVTAYTEKPITKSLVCSAICVAGPEALAAIPTDQATGLSELARQLITAGHVVEAFPHEAAWIDVNDVASIARAEQLMIDCREQFAWFAGDCPSKLTEAA